MTVKKPQAHRSSDLVYGMRASAEGRGFTGHASTWWAVDSYYSAMAPGAFSRTLADRMDLIKVLYNHRPDDYIGTPDVLEEDAIGLRVEASIFDDGGIATVFYNRLQQGAKFGMSFGFQEIRGRPATEQDPLNFSQYPGLGWSQIWITEEVKLFEVSPVTFAANEEAAIEGIRSLAIADTLRSLYDDIRNGTLSDVEREALSLVVSALPAGPPVANVAPARQGRHLEAEIALARYGHYAMRESA